MSYLSLPNLAFSGRFQADTSTVNNNVFYYNTEKFDPSYQAKALLVNDEYPAVYGYWNPEGTGAFRLIDAKVTKAQTSVDDPGTDDVAVGLFINAQEARTSAKLVDLDPQWQYGSMIFGLRIILTDGTTEYMRGDYRPAPFRDIYFGRKPAGHGVQGSETASAKFTSILENVEFTEAAEKSPILMALKASAESNDDRLSINLMTGGFSKQSTYGIMCGSIGPWEQGDPLAFVAGRRFSIDKAGSAYNGMCNSNGIGFFDAQINGTTLSADLSNALPQDAANQARNIGDLGFAIITVADEVRDIGKRTGTAEPVIKTGAYVGADDVDLIGTIPYTADNWLFTTSGLCQLTMTEEQTKLAAERPLALVECREDGSFRIMSRETPGGFFVRADNFEFRLDPDFATPASDHVHILGLQYGAPCANLPISIEPQPRTSGGSNFDGPDQPSIPIPDVNFPENKISIADHVTTSDAGWVSVPFVARNPDNPREYVDGQIFQINYGPAINGPFPAPMFEMIVAHVRDAVHVPDDPDWETDVAPFMQQYDNLYPVMSKWLFSLADPDVVKDHAKILAFAFERPFEDPNHMPVTRDMSAGKRQIILNWLAKRMQTAPPQVMPKSDPPPTIENRGPAPVPLAKVTAADWQALHDALPAHDDGKSMAARNYALTQIAALKGRDT
ncbi:hypothetical protein [Shimia ponticola]|uniref:hypothetical protein n=1 Tax=Shimia ponticola TaxID=2582893 RepID=UPI0011BE7182|nr:hypothetical protein [Shimia ponticola]